MRIAVAPFVVPTYRKPAMGQQHRVRAKRKRRHAYLDRKKVSQQREAPRIRQAEGSEKSGSRLG